MRGTAIFGVKTAWLEKEKTDKAAEFAGLLEAIARHYRQNPSTLIPAYLDVFTLEDRFSTEIRIACMTGETVE